MRELLSHVPAEEPVTCPPFGWRAGSHHSACACGSHRGGRSLRGVQAGEHHPGEGTARSGERQLSRQYGTQEYAAPLRSRSVSTHEAPRLLGRTHLRTWREELWKDTTRPVRPALGVASAVCVCATVRKVVGGSNVAWWWCGIENIRVRLVLLQLSSGEEVCVWCVCVCPCTRARSHSVRNHMRLCLVFLWPVAMFNVHWDIIN